MISMPLIESIRDMSRRGVSNAEIQRRTGASQPTIRKYLVMDDFSPTVPKAQSRPSKLDPYKPFVDSILEDDCSVWRKQRHSVHRIYERLLDETGYDGKYGIVKNYVRRRRAEISAADGFEQALREAYGVGGVVRARQGSHARAAAKALLMREVCHGAAVDSAVTSWPMADTATMSATGWRRAPSPWPTASTQ